VATVAVHSVLARTQAALEKGRGAEAAQLLAPMLRPGSLAREDEFAIRSALAESWLLQDDLAQAAATLGRPPDTLREPISDAAFVRGEPPSGLRGGVLRDDVVTVFVPVTEE